MKKTTVREFDAKGKLVKETITEEDDATSVAWMTCSCHWSTVCPVHGLAQRYRYPYTWTTPNVYPYPQTITVSADRNTSYSLHGALT